MNKELIQKIIDYVTLAIKLAPAAKQVAVDGKKLVQGLFSEGLIDAETQKDLYEWANADMEDALAGGVPPALVVED